jgi:hypothetical protein
MPGTILAWCGYGRRNIRLGTGGVVVTRSSMSLKVSSYCHASVKLSITAPFIFEAPSTTVAWQMAQRGEERGRRNRGVKGWPGQAEGKRSSPPEKYVVVRGFGMEKPPHVYCTVVLAGQGRVTAIHTGSVRDRLVPRARLFVPSCTSPYPIPASVI